jgi:hypothetical protein
MEGVASRCGSVVSFAQLGHELVKDGIVVRLWEGELVYARRGERFFGVAFDPQFTTECEYRRQTKDVVMVSMSQDYV